VYKHAYNNENGKNIRYDYIFNDSYVDIMLGSVIKFSIEEPIATNA
jgi:hypothetical protein